MVVEEEGVGEGEEDVEGGMFGFADNAGVKGGRGVLHICGWHIC